MSNLEWPSNAYPDFLLTEQRIYENIAAIVCGVVSPNTCNDDVTLVGLYNHLVADGICLVHDDNILRVREVNRSEITDGFCVRVKWESTYSR